MTKEKACQVRLTQRLKKVINKRDKIMRVLQSIDLILQDCVLIKTNQCSYETSWQRSTKEMRASRQIFDGFKNLKIHQNLIAFLISNESCVLNEKQKQYMFPLSQLLPKQSITFQVEFLDLIKTLHEIKNPEKLFQQSKDPSFSICKKYSFQHKFINSSFKFSLKFYHKFVQYIIIMMLRSSKLVSRLLLTRCRQMFSKPSNFGTKELEDRAYLAVKIISLIQGNSLQQIQRWHPNASQQLQQRPETLIKKQSLAIRIVQMIRKQKIRMNLNDSAANHLESFFTTGVKYDETVFNQRRMKTGSTLFHDEYETCRKFIFLPTYTVTSKVFNKIIQNAKDQPIFTGHIGISKSISVMLYGMLSKIITQYKLKIFDQTEQLSFDQMEPLKIRSQIINRSYPHLLYYNYVKPDTQRKRKITQQEEIQQLMQDLHEKFLRQCGLRQQKTNQVFHIKSGEKQINLKRFCEKRNIELNVIIDQFNQLMSLNRESQILKIERLKDSQQTQKQIEINKKIQKFKKMLTQIQQNVGDVDFLSSVSYERCDIQKLKLAPQHGHQTLKQFRINYLDIINNDISAYQIADIFLFLLQQKNHIKFSDLLLKNSKTSSQSSQTTQKNKSQQGQNEDSNESIKQNESQMTNSNSQLRQFLFNELKTYQGRHALTFYTMRKIIFDKDYDNLNLRLQQAFFKKQIDKLKSQCKYFLGIIVNLSLSSLKSKFNQFLNKQKTHSKEDFHRIQLFIYFSALEVLKDKTKIASRKFELKHNKQLLSQSALKSIKNMLEYHLVQIQQEDKIFSLIPPDFLVQIMENEIGQSFKYLVENKISDLTKYLNSSGFGGMVETVFIDMMQKQKIKLKMILQKGTPDSKYTFYNVQSKIYVKQIPKFILKRKIGKIYQKLKKKQERIEFKRKIFNQNQMKLNQLNQSSQRGHQSQSDAQKNPQNLKLALAYNLKQSLKNSIIHQIQKIRSDPLKQAVLFHTLLFVPSTQNLEEKIKIVSDRILTPQELKNIVLKVKNNNNFSKAIDFILVNLNLTPNSLQIQINAIDMTDSMDKTNEKIYKFVEEFCCFQDRNTDHLQIKSQNQTQTFQAELNYFVLAPGNFNKNLTSKLNKNFGKFLKFTQLPKNQDICQVESNEGTGSKSFLKNVGFLKIGEQLVVDTVVKENLLNETSDYRIWKKIEEYLMKYYEIKRKQQEGQQEGHQEDEEDVKGDDQEETI